jgi:glycogen debranching enzyme
MDDHVAIHHALGATFAAEGVRFAVRSETARHIWLCLFDRKGEAETSRIELARGDDAVFSAVVPGLKAGQRYGLRADGLYEPSAGFWFDPAKLLVDPYATRLDRPFVQDPRLAEPRSSNIDTAPLVPKAVVEALPEPVARQASLFKPGGLVYEVNVSAFTIRHPKLRKAARGTIGALAEPMIIEHLVKLGVGAVELMPVTPSIDERHLPALGLSNAWGYNPVTFMALDPRIAPGGIAELREAVAALHKAGIAVILDVVFNHTGESDIMGPTLSLRGLDNWAYYSHSEDGRLANETGCGNVVNASSGAAQRLILDSLRHFVVHAGVDGFRFDLAPVLGRVGGRFAADAALLETIRRDAVLADRTLIAEPWDIGPEGYQLGRFGEPFLEWNDRYRDDMRRFWRNDRGTIGALATRLAGSSDVFGATGRTRTLNFIAAHDGMTLADLSRYERKHNEANGEENRDGHNENYSWNNGVEGETDDREVLAARQRDSTALLATLFASRGTIMLTAGDEFGRTQHGNNNAYAQANDITWLDWKRRDLVLEDWCAALSRLRRESPALSATHFLTGHTDIAGLKDVEWFTELGQPMTVHDWEEPLRHRLVVLLAEGGQTRSRLAVLINGDRRGTVFTLPLRDGYVWEPLLFPGNDIRRIEESGFLLPGRALAFVGEATAS